jgi:Na+/H+-dicarboxylate symporter
LGIIPFCLLFGFFTSKIDSHIAHTLLGFWKGVFEVTMLMTKFIMRALPLGVFALIGHVVATAKPELFSSLASFTVTTLVALGVYALVILPLVLKLNGINVTRFYKALSPALLTAFTTSSSAATLPVTLECVEKEANISNRVSSFVLPLGTSINLPGSALYQCVAVFFIVQVYGIELSWTSSILVMVLSLVTTFGMAGIPSASLVSTVLILHTFGIPDEGIGLLAAIDRFLDMCRTPVNVLGSSSSTALVAKSEGETL